MKPFAFVFPGQGSQSVGMLDAWGDHPAVRATLDEASQALGEDVARLIHAGPKEALDLTSNTQPVMLTAAIACYRAWRTDGGDEPAAVANRANAKTRQASHAPLRGAARSVHRAHSPAIANGRLLSTSAACGMPQSSRWSAKAW